MLYTHRGPFPQTRMRRNRTNDNIRRLLRENNLSVDDFIWPCFIVDGQNVKAPVGSMPGVFRYSLDTIVDAALEAEDLGIPAIAIFPHTDPSKKTATASEALNANNLVCLAVQAVKSRAPDLMIVCDVALDPYTDHGHDGLLDGHTILNDETIEVLEKQAILQAEAGCDTLAPSDMMDGRIGAVRRALDSAGFQDRRIMSYAAKYASGFYGPFREAVGSGGALRGDKRTYQMDPGNSDEALHEVALDLQEGADIVIVKPGMPYLDIIQRIDQQFGVPIVAYQVSGEYSMIKAAVDKGWLDHDKAMMESLIAFKRAGASAVLTYFAKDAARLLQKR